MNSYEEINKKLKQLNIKEITLEELKKISFSEKKSIEEIIQNIIFSLKDLGIPKLKYQKLFKIIIMLNFQIV